MRAYMLVCVLVHVVCINFLTLSIYLHLMFCDFCRFQSISIRVQLFATDPFWPRASRVRGAGEQNVSMQGLGGKMALLWGVCRLLAFPWEFGKGAPSLIFLGIRGRIAEAPRKDRGREGCSHMFIFTYTDTQNIYLYIYIYMSVSRDFIHLHLMLFCFFPLPVSIFLIL